MRDKPYRPGILASRKKRMDLASRKAEWLWIALRNMIEDHRAHGNDGMPPIPELVRALRRRGEKAPRGGPVTFNTVQRVLDRFTDELRMIGTSDEIVSAQARKLSFGHLFRLVKKVDDQSVIGEEGMILRYETGERLLVVLGTIGKPDYREIAIPVSAIEIIS